MKSDVYQEQNGDEFRRRTCIFFFYVHLQEEEKLTNLRRQTSESVLGRERERERERERGGGYPT